MGIYFKNYAEQNFMLAIFHGEVVDDELDAHTTELLKEKYNTPKKIGLTVFCKNAVTEKLSHRMLISTAQRMQQASFRKNSKLALVANNTVDFGMAKTYQIACKQELFNEEVIVLRGDELDSAIQWLGVTAIASEILNKVNQIESASAILI